MTDCEERHILEDMEDRRTLADLRHMAQRVSALDHLLAWSRGHLIKVLAVCDELIGAVAWRKECNATNCIDLLADKYCAAPVVISALLSELIKERIDPSASWTVAAGIYGVTALSTGHFIEGLVKDVDNTEEQSLVKDLLAALQASDDSTVATPPKTEPAGAGAGARGADGERRHRLSKSERKKRHQRRKMAKQQAAAKTTSPPPPAQPASVLSYARQWLRQLEARGQQVSAYKCQLIALAVYHRATSSLSAASSGFRAGAEFLREAHELALGQQSLKALHCFVDALEEVLAKVTPDGVNMGEHENLAANMLTTYEAKYGGATTRTRRMDVALLALEGYPLPDKLPYMVKIGERDDDGSFPAVGCLRLTGVALPTDPGEAMTVAPIPIEEQWRVALPQLGEGNARTEGGHIYSGSMFGPRRPDGELGQPRRITWPVAQGRWYPAWGYRSEWSLTPELWHAMASVAADGETSMPYNEFMELRRNMYARMVARCRYSGHGPSLYGNAFEAVTDAVITGALGDSVVGALATKHLRWLDSHERQVFDRLRSLTDKADMEVLLHHALEKFVVGLNPVLFGENGSFDQLSSSQVRCRSLTSDDMMRVREGLAGVFRHKPEWVVVILEFITGLELSRKDSLSSATLKGLLGLKEEEEKCLHMRERKVGLAMARYWKLAGTIGGFNTHEFERETAGIDKGGDGAERAKRWLREHYPAEEGQILHHVMHLEQDGWAKGVWDWIQFDYFGDCAPGDKKMARYLIAWRHTLDPELLQRMRDAMAALMHDDSNTDLNDTTGVQKSLKRARELLKEAGPALPSPPSESESSDPKILGSVAVLQGLTEGTAGARLEGKRVVVLGVAQDSTKCCVGVLDSGGGCAYQRAEGLHKVLVKREKLRLLELGKAERVMTNHLHTTCQLQGLVRNKDLNGMLVTMMPHADGSAAKLAVATAGPRKGDFVLKACVKASGYDGIKHVPVESLSCFRLAMQDEPAEYKPLTPTQNKILASCVKPEGNESPQDLAAIRATWMHDIGVPVSRYQRRGGRVSLRFASDELRQTGSVMAFVPTGDGNNVPIQFDELVELHNRVTGDMETYLTACPLLRHWSDLGEYYSRRTDKLPTAECVRLSYVTPDDEDKLPTAEPAAVAADLVAEDGAGAVGGHGHRSLPAPLGAGVPVVPVAVPVSDQAGVPMTTAAAPPAPGLPAAPPPRRILEEMLLSLFAIGARPNQPAPETLTEAECRAGILENLINSGRTLRSNMNASGITDIRFGHEDAAVPSVSATDLLDASQDAASALLLVLSELLLDAVRDGYLEVVPDEVVSNEPRYRLIDLPAAFRARLASMNIAPGRL